MKALLMGALCAGVVLAVACGGSSNTKKETSSSGPTAAPTKTAVTAAAGGATAKASPAAGKAPANPCELLTADDLATLGSGAGAGEPKTDPTGARCYWQFGNTALSLTLTVMTLPSGFSADSLKAPLQAKLRDAGENGHEVPGVGSYAIYTSVLEIDAEAQAIVNGLVLDVNLNGPGARGLEKPLIAALRAAAGRM